jgi:hypothetical protein
VGQRSATSTALDGEKKARSLIGCVSYFPLDITM